MTKPKAICVADNVVKKEIFEALMETYDIITAFEDRPHVADMIEGLGITCVRV